MIAEKKRIFRVFPSNEIEIEQIFSAQLKSLPCHCRIWPLYFFYDYLVRSKLNKLSPFDEANRILDYWALVPLDYNHNIFPSELWK